MDEKQSLSLYRKRFIPDELVHLKKDYILEYIPEKLLVTSWETIKPRKDFVRGISAFFLDRGLKVSKLIDAQGKLYQWYCDIGMFRFEEDGRCLIFEDLLFDVVIHADGSFSVLDIDEACEAFRERKITEEQLLFGMKALHGLLTIIQNKQFHQYSKVVEEHSLPTNESL